MPALLSITYTPNYAGNHRICFKTTQPSYCCYNDDSTSVIGVAKTTVIDLEDFELCLQDLPQPIGCSGSIVDGYVQPFCIEQGSSVNRIPFTATFASNPCTPYKIECTESGIGEISVVNPGYGWPIGVVPTVTINTSGSGFGFSATTIMECLPGDNFCSIDSISIDNSGQEYFYLNQLSIDVSPLPSCVSDELLVNGNFNDGFLNWNVIPPVDGWELTPSGIPYYNIPVYGSAGGTIEQPVLTPGKTYLIDFEKVTVEARSGTVRFIVSAGLFSSTGTGSNQYMITRNVGDPDFDGPLSITLTCFGSAVFSIYADSSTTDPLNTARLTEVSVVELCEVIEPELEITLRDNCGTFTLPNCDGSDNPTEYEIQGTPAYAINVCSGGAGPVGAKYTITPNPIDVSCCDCIKYDVINTDIANSIEFYYTDCLTQVITTQSIDAGDTLEICAVRNSVWPADPNNNQYLEYILSGIQDC